MAVGAAVDTQQLAAAEEAQRAAAAERVRERGDERALKIAAITTPGGLAGADEPERIVSRIDRLSTYYPDVRPVSPAELVAGKGEALRAAGAVLERIINTPDFVDVRFLEAGERAARAVGRIDIRDDRGRLVGYGTGSLVSPRLLLTNHHVLPTRRRRRAARSSSTTRTASTAGRCSRCCCRSTRTASSSPTSNSTSRSSRSGGATTLRAFGFNRLIAAEGKAIPGDFVTIVQHPRGEKKQVALRDNRVVDVFDFFLHYQADTEPGSSGSPVFNDQWEVVALHHAGVPAPEHTEFGGWVNEGIRISRILRFIGDQQLPAHSTSARRSAPSHGNDHAPGNPGSGRRPQRTTPNRHLPPL